MEAQKMKIKYVSEDTLAFLRENSKSLYEHVFVKKYDIDSFVGKNDSILELPSEYPEIQFYMQNEDRPSTDFENIKKVYGTLRNVLTDSLASDERIWIGLIFSDALEYMKYRWPADDYKKMINRYFFEYKGHRALFRNGLSRLWWIGRLSYEKGAEDPYCRTKYLVSRQDIIETFCGRNIFNNPDLFKTTLVSLQRCEENGISFNREFIRDIAKYINMLGGVYVLDALPLEDVSKKIEDYIITNFRRYE